MIYRYLHTFLICFTAITSMGQKSAFEFTFTAIDSASYVQLDSVKIMNRTQGNKHIIFWPDTTISLELASGDTLLYVGYATFNPVGINDRQQEDEDFSLFQNYPNPVIDQSTVAMFIPGNGMLQISVSDVQGRIIFRKNFQMERGRQDFRFVPGSGKLFFLTASWNGRAESIKILSNAPHSSQQCLLKHIGSGQETISIKASSQIFKGYIKESGIIDMPSSNKDYIFQFMDNSPCPGTPTVTYGAQVYNTVQILSQCWLKENLNIGTMIDAPANMEDNGTMEKFCYDNDADSCAKYGGLYEWPEMMQYSTLQGSQGICPPGWHVPTDEEWKILEGAVDSQYGIGDPEWDIIWNFRGFDVGYHLKATHDWFENGNGDDMYGFTGLPGGALGYDSGGDVFVGKGTYSYWWTSKELSEYSKFERNFGNFTSRSFRMVSSKSYGYAVRCLKDN